MDFPSIEDATGAMDSMQGEELDGRNIRVDFALPRDSTPGSGGGGWGGRGSARGGGRGKLLLHVV